MWTQMWIIQLSKILGNGVFWNRQDMKLIQGILMLLKQEKLSIWVYDKIMLQWETWCDIVIGISSKNSQISKVLTLYQPYTH